MARPASAFGVLGHQVIASLAEDMLTPKAKAEVKNILGPAGGSASLASISTWADDIRMLRPETRPWHYVTIQIREARYDSSRADSANVVKALKRQLAILAAPDADRYAREEALKWIVHLTGDLHQPLHAGEDHDKGGNLAKVKVNRRTYSLHEVWDYVLLERLHLPLDSLRGMLERDIAADPDFIRRNAAGSVEDWTDGTHAESAACYLLRGKPMRKGIKVRLDKDYVQAATLTVLAQLKIAGVRLAFALNRALDPESHVAAVSPAKPSAGRRGDPGAYFARADAIREAAGDADAVDSVAGAGAAAPARENAEPAKSRGPRIPEGKYAWSVNSGAYHFSACADVARIRKKNLRSGNAPPPGMRLHAGCPIPR
ncbi:MAG TPA: S1/P1 nuclease [Fibrobacteria bacterium]|nr:S1/P1 nuclease [Fibrobacteria bacterium]